MTKQFLLTILTFFCFLPVFAQQQRAIDNLFQVKDYLLEIKNVINSNNMNGRQQYEQIATILRSASGKEKQLEVSLKEIIPIKHPDYKTMTADFHWIIQSAALYRSDLMNNGYKRDRKNQESIYLNQKIPGLVSMLYKHCHKK